MALSSLSAHCSLIGRGWLGSHAQVPLLVEATAPLADLRGQAAKRVQLKASLMRYLGRHQYFASPMQQVPLSLPAPTAPPVFSYAALLAKHGYSLASYQLVIQEAVESILAGAPATGQPSPETLASEVQAQLFHVALARLATPAIVLEQLMAYFAAGGTSQAPEATVYLLEHLGPLHEADFYHATASLLSPQPL